MEMSDSATGMRTFEQMMTQVFVSEMENLSHWEDCGVDDRWFYGMLWCRSCKNLAQAAYSGKAPLTEVGCGYCGRKGLMKVTRLHWRHQGGRP